MVRGVISSPFADNWLFVSVQRLIAAVAGNQQMTAVNRLKEIQSGIKRLLKTQVPGIPASASFRAETLAVS
jgi:hypothetical protein